MRSSASLIVLVIVALIVAIGIIAGQGERDAVATLSDTETVAEPFDVAVGGAGSEATIAAAAGTPASVSEPQAGSTEPATTAEEQPQEWVTVPGTPIGLWPKPASK